MMTTITKLLHEARVALGVKIEPKSLLVDFKNERAYRKLIEENFQRVK